MTQATKTMGISVHGTTMIVTLVVISLVSSCSATIPRKLALVQLPPLVLKYHGGPLLTGNVTVNLIWYGKFSPVQQAIVVDFLHSFNTIRPRPPSVALWWHTTKFYKGGSRNVVLGSQVFDKKYSLGKSLRDSQIIALASNKGNDYANTVNVLLTAADVTVDGFCMSRCGTHGSSRTKNGKRFTYAWVGNSVTQCPGECAWPFHQAMFGPLTPPLVAPNGDVGIDGMLINLATVLAGVVTNPFDTGYFQGPASLPQEAVTACTGIFGSGAFPGYPGSVLVDKRTKASYNAQGVNGRKYLLPAMWDPRTSTCKTLV